MQLDEGLSEAKDTKRPPAVKARRKPLPPLVARGLGQTMTLAVTADQYLRDDSYWRLRSIYEPALTSQTLAKAGVALDIGAGFGCFAIPFALANRGWTVWAFEPEADAFAALCANIRSCGATNVIPVHAAVTGNLDAADPAPVAAALAAYGSAASGAAQASAMAGLMKLLPKRHFRRHVEMRGVIEFGEAKGKEFEDCQYPCLPAEALLALQPRLLKLLAPFAETAILSDLTTATLDHLIGESWAHIPSDLVYGQSLGQRQTWIPRAGDPILRLRRAPNLNGHRPGLDIVVAMYNSGRFIVDCVDSLLEDGNPDIRVLVVDDGSTDGAGDLVAKTYEGHARVLLLRKENGGCASARNYGRMHSDASHIAFVDADDVAGPGLFDGLLDLARHTGAELVQGGFQTFYEGGEGKEPRFEPSYESQLPEVVHAFRHPMGERTCLLAPSWLLMQGQPSIWRRIYRRDFLDNRNIWFPEHIRAFDDQIFQLRTLQHVPNVPMLDGVHYHYRQHPGQDIRQGDERHFYSLEMFRMVLKRGITEGWNDFRPMLASYVKTVNWCWTSLRADLKPAFEQGAAELWVLARFTLDDGSFAGLGDDQFLPPDFGHYCRRATDRLRHLDRNYGHAYLDSILMHPGTVRALMRNGQVM